MEKLFNVTNTAKITQVHPQTLRHYEKIGLVIPLRTLGGVRRYSQFDIDKILVIRKLSNDGINLEGIRLIINQQEEINILRRQLEALKQDRVFTSGNSGITVEQFSKMGWRDRLKLYKQMRKMYRKKYINNSNFLSIESK